MRARLLLAVVLLVAGGCATVDPREDTRIEAEVKARLVAEPRADLTRLGVLSTQATVYLSGTVASEDQRTRAEMLTREVRGVQRVVNTVEVRSPAR